MTMTAEWTSGDGGHWNIVEVDNASFIKRGGDPFVFDKIVLRRKHGGQPIVITDGSAVIKNSTGVVVKSLYVLPDAANTRQPPPPNI